MIVMKSWEETVNLTFNIYEAVFKIRNFKVHNSAPKLCCILDASRALHSKQDQTKTYICY